ncbi:SPOR domain-containing protein [Fodinibius sp. Rm-B-1B1-1]|uniref:SPOR domain-containing protein n=1 Tax=Fodinibius alkaliphilus TaxID=3140241 RepID=UPI00315ACF5E
MFRTFWITILLTIAVGLLISCKSTEETTQEQDKPIVTEEETSDSEAIALLDNTRSQLNHVYLTQKQDIPEIYLKADSSKEEINRNPYDGFRIQILSTRKVEYADSVANSFRMWADTTITGYSADAYVSFRQPYYKVHIGDFQQRNQANQFSRLIKPKYPDAWVVHDRIEPANVPADTATFQIKKPEPLSADSLNTEDN